jgi:hypothetical protein
MIFEAEHKPAVLIATRMHSARAILGKAIGHCIVPSAGEALALKL